MHRGFFSLARVISGSLSSSSHKAARLAPWEARSVSVFLKGGSIRESLGYLPALQPPPPPHRPFAERDHQSGVPCSSVPTAERVPGPPLGSGGAAQPSKGCSRARPVRRRGASGQAGRKGLGGGWAEETPGSPAGRPGPGAAPDHCVQWAGLKCGKGRPHGSPPPALTSGGLAPPQLGGAAVVSELSLSLVTGRGGAVPAQSCGAEEAPSGG